MNHLAASFALEGRASRQWRVSVKILAASLLRHQWDGGILIGRNSQEPLFPMERAGVEEVELENPVSASDRQRMWRLAGGRLSEVDGWILLLDADCVVLRNLDHLLGEGGDVRIPHGGYDPGVIAIRSGVFEKFMEVPWPVG